MDQWAVLIENHHPGFIDWTTYQANQARLDSNTRPKPHQAGGAVKEGSALLQGIATWGHCGRRLHVHYRGRNSTSGYHCSGKNLVEGRGVYCLNIGGLAIEQAVAHAFLDAVTPAAVEAMRLTVEQLQSSHDAALSQWRLEAERMRYESERAERRYRMVEPENRLVARGLEAEWENRLRELAAAETELHRASSSRRAHWIKNSSNGFSCSAPISVPFGSPSLPPAGIVRNCSARFWKKSGRSCVGPQARRGPRSSDSALARRCHHYAGRGHPTFPSHGAAH
jgi:hypothetical protein